MADDITLNEIQLILATEIETVETVIASGLNVIVSDGTDKTQIEDQLEDKGIVMIVNEPYDLTPRDQKSNSVIAVAKIFVEIEENPTRNFAATGAQVNRLFLAYNIITAIISRNRHEGGEFFRFEGQSTGILFEGTVLTVIEFSKELTL